MRKKVSRLPTQKKALRRLRRVPVKIGARTLLFYRPVFRLGPFRLMRGADGSLFWRWRQGRHHRLTPASDPSPEAPPYRKHPANGSK